jgi:hypothetical protein
MLYGTAYIYIYVSWSSINPKGTVRYGYEAKSKINAVQVKKIIPGATSPNLEPFEIPVPVQGSLKTRVSHYL